MRQCAPLIVCVFLVSDAATPSIVADNDQRRAAVTLKRMDVIANSIQTYIANAHRAPDATSIESLRSLLSPAYMTNLPIRDEWNTPFRYVKSGNQSFQIISAGSDGKFARKAGAWRHTRTILPPMPSTLNPGPRCRAPSVASGSTRSAHRS